MFSWLLNLWLLAWFHNICGIPNTKRKNQFPDWTMFSIYFWQERLLFFLISVLQRCCSVCFPFGNYPWSIVSAPAISTGYSRLMGRLIVFPFGSSTLAIISNLSHSSFTFRCTFFDMNDLSHHWIHSWFGSCFLQACFGIVLSNWADSDNTNVSENHSDVFAFFLNFQ